MTEANLSFKEQPITTLAIDDLAGQPDLIKIDVEGAELDVLKGAERCLERQRPLLFIERGSRPEISAFLEGFGYKARGDQGVNTVFVAR